MSDRLPLLEGSADTPLLWQNGHPVSRGAFASTVMQLAEQLPACRCTLNRCRTRFAFLVALLASAVRNIPCLLDSAAYRAGRRGDDTAGSACVLSEDLATADVVVSVVPQATPGSVWLPRHAADDTIAVVFTSGSTGQPKMQHKSWLALSHAARQIATRLLPPAPTQLVATVPMHHMYGLETSIVLPLVTPHRVAGNRPAFPEDVRSELAAVPEPRVLVTAPVHLRALLNSKVQLPRLQGIISATAPLTPALARRAEDTFGAPVNEIYGCTEAGSIASRRTTVTARWTPLPTMDILVNGGQPSATGPHFSGPIALHDALKADGAGGFLLLGREGDIVKVAGERASLADLTHKLLSIPGVEDGIVFQPDWRERSAVVRRLAALVVTPRLSETDVLSALSRLVDPIFLPRPLRKVDQLPRNATGKLPHDVLRKLLSRA